MDKAFTRSINKMVRVSLKGEKTNKSRWEIIGTTPCVTFYVLKNK